MSVLANQLADSVLQAVADRLATDSKIAAAYLLGSGAEGCLRKDSDVDLALLPVRGASFTGRERLEPAADLGVRFRLPKSAGRSPLTY